MSETTNDLPAQGGSYVRTPTGTLQRAAVDAPEATAEGAAPANAATAPKANRKEA